MPVVSIGTLCTDNGTYTEYAGRNFSSGTCTGHKNGNCQMHLLVRWHD